MAHTIHGRFKLYETTRQRVYTKTEKSEWEPVEGARVKMMPVQGEPFGSATPSGTIEMVIANQHLVPDLLTQPLDMEYDVVFFPRHEGKSHPDLHKALGLPEE